MAKIGSWDFTSTTPTKDRMGLWADLELMSGSNPIPTAGAPHLAAGDGLCLAQGQWARARGFRGGPIRDKTLVVWLELTSLAPRTAGAPISIDAQGVDEFDAITFGERRDLSWAGGSSRFRRTAPHAPDQPAETQAGTVLQLAATYTSTGNGANRSRIYRNGALIFSSDQGPQATWAPNAAELLFGPRHTQGNNPIGFMNARLIAAEVHDVALSAAQVGELAPPQPLGSVVEAVGGLRQTLIANGLGPTDQAVLQLDTFRRDVQAGKPTAWANLTAGAAATAAFMDSALTDRAPTAPFWAVADAASATLGDLDALSSEAQRAHADAGVALTPVAEIQLREARALSSQWSDRVAQRAAQVRGGGFYRAVSAYATALTSMQHTGTAVAALSTIMSVTPVVPVSIPENLLSGDQPTFALLIGVTDYTRFDLSADKRPGTSDLQGCLDDVVSFATLARAMGVCDEDMVVLTTPKLNANAFPGIAPGWTPHPTTTMVDAFFDYADHSNVRGALQWLADKLQSTPGSRGLLYFSGHSAWITRDGASAPALCPSDATVGVGGDVHHAITYDEVMATFAGLPDDQPLNLVLDTCLEEGSTRTLTQTGTPPADYRFALRPRDVLLAASQMGEPAFSSVFDGRWHGAFTWALATVLGQRPVSMSANGRFFELSYAALLRRIGRFLDELGVSQQPALWSAQTAGAQPVAPRGEWPVFGYPTWQVQARLMPSRAKAEVTGGAAGWGYRIKDSAGAGIGWLIVTRAWTSEVPTTQIGNQTFTNGRDHWFLDSGSFPTGAFALEKLFEPKCNAEGEVINVNTLEVSVPTLPAPSSATFMTSSKTFNVGTGASGLSMSGTGFRIYTLSGSTQTDVGYIAPGSGQLDWHQLKPGSGSGVAALAPGAQSGRLYFAPVTDLSTITGAEGWTVVDVQGS
jgi:hypothetical protein